MSAELYDMIFEKSPQRQRLDNICPGLMLGTVKQNWDKEHQGMVMVEYSVGEKGKSTSGWIPVMQSYAGKQYGSYTLPEIDSIVVVGYLLGELDSPVVLGCLWNKKNELPSGTANDSNSIKKFITKGGHQIIFDETKDEERIVIKTKGALNISLEDKEQVITVSDQSGENLCRVDGKKGEVTIAAKKKLILQSGGKPMVTLDGTGKKLTLEADNIDLAAGQALKIKGQSTKMESNMLEVKAQGSLKAQSGAMMEVKAAMLKVQ
ncbi:MAG: phage baseplate assembly protein V [Lachnospiraceae bacterium]|nr:phage baseplate assembly protein V [Lachnospiraceae bacterium]